MCLAQLHLYLLYFEPVDPYLPSFRSSYVLILLKELPPQLFDQQSVVLEPLQRVFSPCFCLVFASKVLLQVLLDISKLIFQKVTLLGQLLNLKHLRQLLVTEVLLLLLFLFIFSSKVPGSLNPPEPPELLLLLQGNCLVVFLDAEFFNCNVQLIAMQRLRDRRDRDHALIILLELHSHICGSDRI